MLRALSVLAVIIFLGCVALWVLSVPESVPAGVLGRYQPDLANGQTMFNSGGCAGCHATPGQADRTTLGGGLALKTPFGTFYAPNISPDLRDGIGGWSEADFVTALWKGTSPRGQHYYPALPYTSYQRMKLADVRDLFAYIKTLPPVEGKASDHAVEFPFNIRRAIGLWKLLYLDGAQFHADPAQSAAWNRGAYLVNGPGHCAECHSPRDVLAGIVAAQRFAGGPNVDGERWVPNITQKGLADWSEKDIVYVLQTGMTPDGDSVGGSMTDVVHNTARLSGADQTAIAVYLKSLPPIQGPAKPQSKQ